MCYDCLSRYRASLNNKAKDCSRLVTELNPHEVETRREICFIQGVKVYIYISWYSSQNAPRGRSPGIVTPDAH